jgi:hypothetical protein
VSPLVGRDTEVCPGCGSVLRKVTVRADRPRRPGASTSCSALLYITLRGARDEAPSDSRTAAVAALADAAYAAQHPEEPAGTTAALLKLALALGGDLTAERTATLWARVEQAAPLELTRPAIWRTTIADLAADLDVVDLPTLVRSWADAVWQDWAGAHEDVRRALATLSVTA